MAPRVSHVYKRRAAADEHALNISGVHVAAWVRSAGADLRGSGRAGIQVGWAPKNGRTISSIIPTITPSGAGSSCERK
jgi:hypothetical protein